MELEQYTPDAICRAMGLDGFVDTTWSSPTIRILLKPSFHPEVCLTLSSSEAGTTLNVVALSEMFWLQNFWCRLPEIRELIAIPDSEFAVIREHFERAASKEEHGRWVCIDGMGCDCCCWLDGEARQFSAHVHHPVLAEMVACLLRLGWNSSQAARIRNSLAACGGYVGVKLPREPEMPIPPTTRMLVLGTPEAKAEYFAMLSKAALDRRKTRQ